MDVSLIVAIGALLISAIVSAIVPWITSSKTLRHEQRMFERRFYEQHRAEALENFLKSAGTVVEFLNNEKFIEYRTSYGEALMYFDSSLLQIAKEFDQCISKMFSGALASYNKADKDRAVELFWEICDTLRNNPPRSKIKG